MANENLLVWITDCHLVSNNSEPGIAGEPTTPAKAAALAAHINSLDPLGCIDTGDNKDNYYADTEDEHDNYITYIQNELPWLPVNSGYNATFPNVPGNHDEYTAEYDTVPGNNDFSATYDVKFWGPPYHWTADWDAARIRFIAIHTYMHKLGTAVDPIPDNAGFAHCDVSEHEWLTDQLNTLPERYQAIVVSHFPIIPQFGNNVKYTGTAYDYQETPLNDILSEHQSKVVVALCGHRHLNWQAFELDGVTHINSGGASYGAGNGTGVFSTITYDPANRSLEFDCRYAASPYARFAGFTPVTFQLQPHRLFFART